MKDQTLIFTKSPGVCNRDSRRRNIFHASVLETPIHFWRAGLTWESSLELVLYIVRREIPFQHPGCGNVTSNVPRVSREAVLYRDESTLRAGKRAMSKPEQKNVSSMKVLM